MHVRRACVYGGRLSSPPYFMYGDIDTIEIAANRLSGDLVDPARGPGLVD